MTASQTVALFVSVLIIGLIGTSYALIPRACSTPQTDKFPFCNPKLSLDARVKDLISRIPLSEKPIILTARASPYGNVSSIGLPAYDWGANCVHGVESKCGTRCASSFTPPCALGASWNDTNVREMGARIGLELRALWLEGVQEAGNSDVIGLDCWSPNININRDPRWGRNQEVPSEDPYLTGNYAIQYTIGMQNGKLDKRFLMGVTTLKHYAAYSVDNYPPHYVRYSFDAIVSAYDLAMTYLPAFHAGIVNASAQGVMCSYNSLNGVPTCASNFLRTILRKEWNYTGYVTTDSDSIDCIWRDHHYTKNVEQAVAVSLRDGETDINSGNSFQNGMLKALSQGLISEKDIDLALYNSLSIRFKLGLFDPIDDQPYWHVSPNVVNSPDMQAFNLFSTLQSLTLLNNQNNVLPLTQRQKTVAVIGPHATSTGALLANYLGEICKGNNYNCVTSPLAAIQNVNGADKTHYAKGCDINSLDRSGFAAAIAAAKASDVVILFMGLDQSIEAEMRDRVSIGLPGVQHELIVTLHQLNKPIILVLIHGGAVAIDWEKDNVPGIIDAFYPGFYGAVAIADVIFGNYNPGGKLPVTIYPTHFVDQIAFVDMNMNQGVGRGYRYYTGTPLYPFGYGLSYTKFVVTWSNISSVSNVMKGEYGQVVYVVRVKNVGNRRGDEVVQGYWKPEQEGSLERELGVEGLPLKKTLFGYQRVGLGAGEEKEVRLVLNGNTMKVADAEGNMRVVKNVGYEVEITNGVDQKVEAKLRFE
eukprot:TRINITY_DN1623_c0_g1_i1.p1 TRINITY_DN1623_c0_g1~~TRINITY_DN1623_c0_g1_i1.p1  ORF type:complete len:758 (-),score=163.69 TRINITY_DN1623_c0_g1_i1:43-2316(-)